MIKNNLKQKVKYNLIKKNITRTEVTSLSDVFYYYEKINFPSVKDTLQNFGAWDIQSFKYSLLTYTKYQLTSKTNLDFLTKFFSKVLSTTKDEPIDLAKISFLSNTTIFKKINHILEEMILKIFSLANVNYLVKGITNELGLKINTFALQLSSSESDIQNFNYKVQNIANKIVSNYIQQKEEEGYDVEENDEYLVLKQNDRIVAFVPLNDLKKEFKTYEELKNFEERDYLIANNYPNLKYNNGKLISEDGQVIKQLDYIEPSKLEYKLFEYERELKKYNRELHSYEEPLINPIKKITLLEQEIQFKNVFYNDIVRPVIIDGPFKGLFLDEMISSTGKVLGSDAEVSYELYQTKKLIERSKDSNFRDMLSDSKEILVEMESPITTKLKDVEEYTDMALYPYQSKYPMIKDSFRNLIGSNFVNWMFNEKTEMKIHPAKIEPDDEGNERLRISSSLKNDVVTIERNIYYRDGKPDYIDNELFYIEDGVKPGLGSRVFIQQVKTASREGFLGINTLAARTGTMVGYYIWPKLGYLDVIDFNVLYGTFSQEDKIKGDRVKRWLNNYISDLDLDYLSIQDLYACRVKDGGFIGQELWKKYGYSLGDAVFDLSPNSLSMRILNEYLKKKAEEEGMSEEEFLQIDYSSYNDLFYNIEELKKLDLETLTKVFEEPTLKKNFFKALIKAIRLDRKDLLSVVVLLLTQNLSFTKMFPRDLIELIVSYSKQSNFTFFTPNFAQQFRNASSEDKEDAVIKDITSSDLIILDSVWEGINKLYEKGLIN